MEVNGMVGGGGKGEAGVVRVAGAKQFGHPGEDDEILHGANGGFASAEILRAVGRDRDEAEAREIVAERDIDRRTALGVERDIAFPEQIGSASSRERVCKYV